MACKCDSGLSNTGTACTPLAAVARQYVFVSKFKEDGTLNKIPLVAGSYTTSFWNTQLNAVIDERWLPTTTVKNVTDEKAENILQSFNDGSSAFISEGVRTVVAFMPKQAPHLAGQINDNRCFELAAYTVDKDGNLVGKEIEDGFLHPIAIEPDTLSALYVKNNASDTVAGINLTFTWSQDEKDEDLTMITRDEMTDSVSGIQGLKDISSTYDNIALTSFEVALKVEGYGSPLSPVLDKGLVAGDFTLFNINDSLAVTIITSVEDTAGGTYTITYAAQGSGEVLRLTPSKDGRDYTLVIANTITLP